MNTQDMQGEKPSATLVISEKTIDLKAVFRAKNPGLARIMPGFVFALLNRIIHVKELNKGLWDYKDLTGHDFAAKILESFGAKIEVLNSEKIPLTGRYTLASNHPFGGLDGLALMSIIGSRRPMVFVSNDLLLFLPNLNMMFVPVNKHGRNKDNIAILQSTFSSEKMVCFFPAGLVSRKQGKEIKDLEWKTTFITQSVKNERDIFPVYIDGQNSRFFYNLALWRKKLGIKANIEMLFLVDEMFKQRKKKIRIIFGDPISYKVFDKSKKPAEWAALVKEHVYAMGMGKDNVLPVSPIAPQNKEI